MSENQSKHGIAGAYYSSDGERYQPIMECLCGYSTGRQSNWEEAGALLDEHGLSRNVSERECYDY